jgi:Tfp pilus assembly protein PilV
MGKLRKNDSGFTMVEVLLVLILAVLIGLSGWYVYHTEHKTSANTSSKTSKTTPIASMLTWTDPSKLYTLNYPSNWTVQQSTGSFQVLIDFTSADTPNATYFIPANSPSNSGSYLSQDLNKSAEPNEVTVSAYTTSGTQDVLLDESFGNEQTPPQNLTINGYPALYDQDILTSTGAQAQYQADLNTPGISNATVPATFTTDRYTVTHDGVTVFFIFTEQEGSSNNQTAFNATSTVPEFTSLVNSIRFLK